MRILADLALQGRRNMIAGANEDDYHLRNVTPGEDFQAEFVDLRQVAAGDTCAKRGAPLEVSKTVEIGHIFKLGYKYSEAMGLQRSERSGQRSHGDHGLVRHRHRADSVRGDRAVSRQRRNVLPASIAPFQVVVTPVNYCGRRADGSGAETLRRAARPRDWTRCSTTATSGPV